MCNICYLIGVNSAIDIYLLLIGFLMLLRPPISTLIDTPFPYTTLFRTLARYQAAPFPHTGAEPDRGDAAPPRRRGGRRGPRGPGAVRRRRGRDRRAGRPRPDDPLPRRPLRGRRRGDGHRREPGPRHHLGPARGPAPPPPGGGRAPRHRGGGGQPRVSGDAPPAR